MRLVAGAVLILRGVQGLAGDVPLGPPGPLIARIVLGVLLIAGLWTPVIGVLVAVLEIAFLVQGIGDQWMHLFLATLGVCLSLLGPGAWSVDAHLFGMRRIDIDPRERPGRA
jgi:hypothetical protein